MHRDSLTCVHSSLKLVGDNVSRETEHDHLQFETACVGLFMHPV